MFNQQPEFRHPELFQQLAFRDYLRNTMPNGRNGYVVEDLDLVLRIYGTNFHSDATGKLMLVEIKQHPAWIDAAQTRTFKLMNDLMRQGDPRHQRYLGYYVLQCTSPDWHLAEFFVNRQPITREQFRAWLNFEDIGIIGLFD